MEYEAFRGILQRAATSIPKFGKFLDGLGHEHTTNNATEDGYKQDWHRRFQRAEIKMEAADHGIERVATGAVKCRAADDILPTIFNEASNYLKWMGKRDKDSSQGPWWADQEEKNPEEPCVMCHGAGAVKAWHKASVKIADRAVEEFDNGKAPWLIPMKCMCPNAGRFAEVASMMDFNEDYTRIPPGLTHEQEREHLKQNLGPKNFAVNPEDLLKYVPQVQIPDWGANLAPQGPQEEGGSNGQVDTREGRQGLRDDTVADAEAHPFIPDPPDIYNDDVPF